MLFVQGGLYIPCSKNPPGSGKDHSALINNTSWHCLPFLVTLLPAKEDREAEKAPNTSSPFCLLRTVTLRITCLKVAGEGAWLVCESELNKSPEQFWVLMFSAGCNQFF